MSNLSGGMLALVLAGAATSAFAEITVGVTLSATGPAASLGVRSSRHRLRYGPGCADGCFLPSPPCAFLPPLPPLRALLSTPLCTFLPRFLCRPPRARLERRCRRRRRDHHRGRHRVQLDIDL